MNKPYAEVIGDPIAHSKSPLIHNFWLGKLGIDAEYRACHVRLEELADYFARRRDDAAWRGCNVTIPHKMAALNYLDDAHLDGLAATNTVVPTGGRLVGWNTDVSGILEPMSRFPFSESLHIDESSSAHTSVAQIIGAGGAAEAAIAAVFAADYLHVEIFNRNIERAKETAARHCISRKNGLALKDVGPVSVRPNHPLSGYYAHYLVINASPMGMVGYPELEIDLSAYPGDTIVFDMVYAPLQTSLLLQAAALGLQTIDGLEMLVGQAAVAFEKFFSQPAPREHDAELRALLTS